MAPSSEELPLAAHETEHPGTSDLMEKVVSRPNLQVALKRFIQQALLQVPQPIFDPSFSEHSYGFRPKRSVHQAVSAVRRFVQDGRRIVVDV